MSSLRDLEIEAQLHGCQVVTNEFIEDFKRVSAENRQLREENYRLKQRLIRQINKRLRWRWFDRQLR